MPRKPSQRRTQQHALRQARQLIHAMTLRIERRSAFDRFFGLKWFIHHEVLRNDAVALLPLLDEALAASEPFRRKRAAAPVAQAQEGAAL